MPARDKTTGKSMGSLWFDRTADQATRGGFRPSSRIGRNDANSEFGTAVSNMARPSLGSRLSNWWSSAKAPIERSKFGTTLGSAAPGRKIKSQLKETEGW